MVIEYSDPRELVVKLLRAKDDSKARSNQAEIGPSELGSCSRKVWYRLNGYEKTNTNTLKLAAIMGTAIHTAVEQALAWLDPEERKFVVESEVAYNGMKAHIDLWIPETGDVIDWKTVKKKNLNYFPSKQQRWQVQVYAYLLDKTGVGKPKNVNLVAIPRDGDERDVRVHKEPYDPAIAEEALGWLEGIKASRVAPDPEKDASFCKDYCDFYDPTGEIGCAGRKKAPTVDGEATIADPDTDKYAVLYLQLNNEIKKLTDHQDSLKEQFIGVSGTTMSGVDISWSTVAPRQSVDTDAVQQALGYVPMKTAGKESVRLNIKHKGN